MGTSYEDTTKVSFPRLYLRMSSASGKPEWLTRDYRSPWRVQTQITQ